MNTAVLMFLALCGILAGSCLISYYMTIKEIKRNKQANLHITVDKGWERRFKNKKN
jgi:hypothetical protein